MPIVKVIAEGVGPFERLELDLSDGAGNPHLGPHILAGVNGSGKSTALRAIAWALDMAKRGFQYDEWKYYLEGHKQSRVLVVMCVPGGEPYARACLHGKHDKESVKTLSDWVLSETHEFGFSVPARVRASIEGECPEGTCSACGKTRSARIEGIWLLFDKHGLFCGTDDTWTGALSTVAAYCPGRRLKYLPNPSLTTTLKSSLSHALSFESTVQNEAVQAWLLSLYSKRAIARERAESSEAYAGPLQRLEETLQLLYGRDVGFEVEIEPTFQPRIRMWGQRFNFSQLPDGVRGTVGWIADFMMREDIEDWCPLERGQHPRILLLDEAENHLHPLWQRKLLPALRVALPDVQVVISSHSPFVISSCSGAKIHVFTIDSTGRAQNRPPVDAPIGTSIGATLRDIFEVESRFDVQTEADLNEWNELKKGEVTGRLKPAEKRRLIQLSAALSERSEELRALVGPQVDLGDWMDDLLTTECREERTKQVRAVSKKEGEH